MNSDHDRGRLDGDSAGPAPRGRQPAGDAPPRRSAPGSDRAEPPARQVAGRVEQSPHLSFALDATTGPVPGLRGGAVLAARAELVATEQLQLSTRNPRRGSVAAIRDSLEANGQYRPLVVNRSSMEVLAGNHTLRAARELGLPNLAVYLIEVSDEQAARIVLVDNRTSDLAGYDTTELADLLAGLSDGDPAGLAGTGYEQADLDKLLDELEAEMTIGDDDLPALPPTPRTQPGDLIELGGHHRLLCGDSRDRAAVEHLLSGEQVDLLLADPPYGVEYRGKTSAALRIENDHAAALPSLLDTVFKNCDGVLAAGAPVYLFHPPGPQAVEFLQAFSAQGWQLRQGLVWVKDTMVLGRSDYHYRHEPIAYGFTPGPGRLGRGGNGWHGDHSETSVLEVPRPQASREHPTMKPVELLARLVANSSRRRGVILDPFAGSGSTLLACERLGRRARLIELDPRYCDVIIDRYERATGNATTTNRE